MTAPAPTELLAALDEISRDAKKLARELQQGLPKRNAAERLEAMHASADKVVRQAASVERAEVAGEAAEPTPHWDRRWPHDQPNGWNLDSAGFLALVQASPMMWLALGRAKYLEMRIDTRDGGFNLYDRDRKPLNPDDVVAAIEKVKADYGDASPPRSEGVRGSEVLTKDALLNAIDSPTVAALADVFSPRNTQNVLSKSYSEQIADILLPRFAPVAQASPEAVADKIIADPKVVWLRECGFQSSARFESELKAAIMRALTIPSAK